MPSPDNYSWDNSAVFVDKHLIGQHAHVTWHRLVLSFGIISLHYAMTSELSIDMNIHVYGAYCHGYQMVYKTLEFRNLVRNSTSYKSVIRLALCLGGNKSTYDSNQLPQIVVVEVSSHFILSGVYSEFIPPIISVTFSELFRGLT